MHYDSDLLVPYINDEGLGIEDVFYDIDFGRRFLAPDVRLGRRQRGSRSRRLSW